jgi:predicted small lipoprotein YifL
MEGDPEVMRTAILALAGLALVAALASCGKQADLERPGPMWGPKAKAEYSAQKRAQAAKVDSETAANSVAEPQNPALEPYTTTSPTPQSPVPGERVYPSGAPQPGGP